MVEAPQIPAAQEEEETKGASGRGARRSGAAAAEESAFTFDDLMNQIPRVSPTIHEKSNES